MLTKLLWAILPVIIAILTFSLPAYGKAWGLAQIQGPLPIFSSIVLTIIATIIMVAAFKLFRTVYKSIIKSFKKLNKYIKPFKFNGHELIPVYIIFNILIVFVKFAGAIIEVVLIYFYLVFVLNLYTVTQNFAQNLLKYLEKTLINIGMSILDYIPSLFFIVVVITIAKYLLKIIKYFFHSVKTGRVRISGFYEEWADPTLKIIQFFIIAFVFAIIFPYLPGANSAAFKGVSIFVGALVTFGSTPAIANIIAGIILTYTRAFRIGDRVKIANAMGDIVEKTLLVTRIRTIKYEIISIPNSVVLSNHIINYSSSSPVTGLILYTSITVGYHVPWRKVHELLISAALSTENILHKPCPFVLQTSLDNSFVTYEINAYTDKPLIMQNTYSELHMNIQDKFNEAGIEIMSPMYYAIRDGNDITIPSEYMKMNYQSPYFKVKNIDN